MKYPIQSLTNKQGEVNFRKKLIPQHTLGAAAFSSEPTDEENLEEFKARNARSLKVFNELVSRNISLSPFLEIAGGQGFRSDLLVSTFDVQGFATDISVDVLSSDRIFVQKLKLGKRSIKICADAYNLPFRTNSFPFVFIALSLHHFPDPLPIIQEAIRVMTPHSYFYFDEEPITQDFNLNLWRRGYHLRWFEKLLKYTLILPFVSRIGKTEVEQGILEETFSLATWEAALAPFTNAEIEEIVYPPVLGLKDLRIKTNRPGWLKPKFIVRLGLFFFGGGIKGICHLTKKGHVPVGTWQGRAYPYKNILELLACPNCRRGNNLAPLKKTPNSFVCVRCKTTFTKRKSVWVLLEKKLEEQLYGKQTK